MSLENGRKFTPPVVEAAEVFTSVYSNKPVLKVGDGETGSYTNSEGNIVKAVDNAKNKQVTITVETPKNAVVAEETFTYYAEGVNMITGYMGELGQQGGVEKVTVYSSASQKRQKK